MVSDQIPAPCTRRCLRIFYVHDRLIYRTYLLFTAYRGSTYADDIFALYKNFTLPAWRVRASLAASSLRHVALAIEDRMFEERRILRGELFTVSPPGRFGEKRPGFNLNSSTINRTFLCLSGNLSRSLQLSRGI